MICLFNQSVFLVWTISEATLIFSWTYDESFFLNIPNNWPICADGPSKLWGIWGYFQLNYQLTFCNFMPLFIDFPLTNQYHYKKLRFKRNFLLGLGYEFWLQIFIDLAIMRP